MIAQKRLYKKELECVVDCQRLVRGSMARRRYVVLRCAALVLQMTFRNNQKMKAIRKEYSTKRNSAIYIQSWWRMNAARRKFDQEKKKIVLCQSIVRGFVQKR